VLRKIAFFQGYNLGRDCLYQTAAQIDASAYTHLFFSFGTLTDDFQVQVGDDLSNFEFREFMRTEGPIKILSIGGWSFSTDPSTYHIFRNGVTPGNRRAMASQIAQFVNANDLDGVNIDWEYPGVSVCIGKSVSHSLQCLPRLTSIYSIRPKTFLASLQLALTTAKTTWPS
jgi:GH18 family chitinase